MNLSHNPNGALKMQDARRTCEQQTLSRRLEISRYHIDRRQLRRNDDGKQIERDLDLAERLATD